MNQDEPTAQVDADDAGLHHERVQKHGADHAPLWLHDTLVVEKPLYFVINGAPLLATMRTPGHDRALALGYLVNEGLIDHIDQLTHERFIPGPVSDTLCLTLEDVDAEALGRLRRTGPSVSSCGVCGRQGQDAFTPRARGPLTPLGLTVASLPAHLAALRKAQPLFERTGGIHAAALLLSADAHAQPVCVREDIGRHNAIDKVAGWLLETRQLGQRPAALLSSGRASYEVIQKAAMMGVGTVVSVSAASSMAVDVARTLGMRLIGFVRGQKAIVYTDPAWR